MIHGVPTPAPKRRVGYVAEKKAANQAAVIEDYLELVRRRDHKEICEAIQNNEQALEALRVLTTNVNRESTDRILNAIRVEFEELKQFILCSGEAPDRPSIVGWVSRELGVQVDRKNGERSFQVGFTFKNTSRCPATVRRADCYLAIQGHRVRCCEGLIQGFDLPSQNTTKTIHCHSVIERVPDGDPKLICGMMRDAQRSPKLLRRSWALANFAGLKSLDDLSPMAGAMPLPGSTTTPATSPIAETIRQPEAH